MKKPGKLRTRFLIGINKDIHKRADRIQDLGQELRKTEEELARAMKKGIGRPIKDERPEIEKCAWAMDYLADNSKVFMGEDS